LFGKIEAQRKAAQRVGQQWQADDQRQRSPQHRKLLAGRHLPLARRAGYEPRHGDADKQSDEDQPGALAPDSPWKIEAALVEERAERQIETVARRRQHRQHA
jgi:hypothetical protein